MRSWYGCTKAINLPENQRIAILLRQYNDLSYNEISE
jgi:DNA-directed RNA polymerase specialized sigma24 family protein